LGQISINVPPLRERREDIAPIAEHFLRQQNLSLTFTPDAIDALQSHVWPGNIRELRNVVTKAAVLARGTQIRAADLGLSFPARPKFNEPVPIDQGAAVNLDRMEKHAILETLAKTNGHQQRAAELLGISRRTLSRKLKLYGMESARQTYAS
jgi:DNA-binding NtrC family response regulator